MSAAAAPAVAQRVSSRTRAYTPTQLAVALLDGRGDRAQVGADAGLGEADRRDRLERGDLGQQRLR